MKQSSSSKDGGGGAAAGGAHPAETTKSTSIVPFHDGDLLCSTVLVDGACPSGGDRWLRLKSRAREGTHMLWTELNRGELRA